MGRWVANMGEKIFGERSLCAGGMWGQLVVAVPGIAEAGWEYRVLLIGCNGEVTFGCLYEPYRALAGEAETCYTLAVRRLRTVRPGSLCDNSARAAVYTNR
jgi:hypothetical protein